MGEDHFAREQLTCSHAGILQVLSSSLIYIYIFQTPFSLIFLHFPKFHQPPLLFFFFVCTLKFEKRG